MRLRAVAVVVGCVLALRPGVAQDTAAATKPMTKEQAEELFRSVDSILKFASDDTKLPIEHEVKRRLVTRDEVTKYLAQKFDEDESAKRMQRSEIVLKKFGLLDRDFALRPFLLGLLTEQVAGFYDEKTKTVNLLDWIPPDDQKPVLAHELTHALQDQKVGLEKWSSDGVKGMSKNVRDDNRAVRVDELETAREAVAEGQAMVVYVDYSLAGTGKTLANSPEIAQKMKDAAGDTSDSPMMARAPLLLQRSLLFPYVDGMEFERQVEVKGGAGAAFAGVLDHPPGSSAEIMHPKAWMAQVPVPVLVLPDLHPLLDAEWEPYDLGVMGELDVEIMANLFGGARMAAGLAPEWAGGVYYAAQRKDAKDKQSTASLGVMYYSQWKNKDSAMSFERIYEEELGRKYSGMKRRTADEREGEEVYSTDEGDVLLWRDDTGVFVAEGFPLKLARAMREVTVGAQGSGKVLNAAGFSPRRELSLGVVSGLAMVRSEMAGRYTLGR